MGGSRVRTLSREDRDNGLIASPHRHSTYIKLGVPCQQKNEEKFGSLWAAAEKLMPALDSRFRGNDDRRSASVLPHSRESSDLAGRVYLTFDFIGSGSQVCSPRVKGSQGRALHAGVWRGDVRRVGEWRLITVKMYRVRGV